MKTLVALGLLVPNLLFAQADLIAIAYNGRVYAIDSHTGAGILVGDSGVPGLNALARDSAGNLFSAGGTAQFARPDLYRIDPISGLASIVAPLNLGVQQISIRGLAFSPGGVLYAVNDHATMTSGIDRLYTIDPLTGIGTLVGGTGMEGIQGLEYSPNGILYAWEVGSGSGFGRGLVTINPLTGLATDVNLAVGGSSQIQSIAFGLDGNLYGAGDALYRIDLVSGAATPIGGGSYSDVRGLAIIPEPAPVAMICLAACLTLLLRKKKR